ncbi:MAG: hypothetical protein VW405_01290 [Rhodospirillaceae bacterium]
MFDPSRMRYVAQTTRALHGADPGRRDEAIAGLIAEAMCTLRRERSGGVTRTELAECGFTEDELTRLGGRAQDLAAADWHGHDMLEAAA